MFGSESLRRVWTVLAFVFLLAALGRAQVQCPPGTQPCLTGNVCSGCPLSTVDYTAHVGPQAPSASYPNCGPIPAFDAATFGTLQAVQVCVTIKRTGARFQMENADTIGSCVPLTTAQWNILSKIVINTNTTPPLVIKPDPGGGIFDFNFTGSLSGLNECPFDGTQDFGGCPTNPNPTLDFGCGPGGPPCVAGTQSGLTRHQADDSKSLSKCFVTTDLPAWQSGPITFLDVTQQVQNESSFCSNLRTTFQQFLTVDINVRYYYCPINVRPIANPDQALVCRSLTPECPSSVDIFVLKNDCDGDQGCPTAFGKIDCGSVMITGAPSHGTATIMSCAGISPLTGCPQTNNCPGCFVRYVPNAGYVGTDTFCYKVGDNGTPQLFSDPAPVSIRVGPGPNVNDDAGIATCRDMPVTFNVLNNDTGASAVAQSAGAACATGSVTPLPFPAWNATTIVCNTLAIVAQPLHGTLSTGQSCSGLGSNCTGTNNCITYTPNAGYVGTDSFTYKVYDTAGCCDTATASITIFCPPLAVDDAATICEELSCAPDDSVLLGVLANDKLCPAAGCDAGCPAPASTINCSTLVIVTQPAHGTLTTGLACGGTADDGCPNSCIRYTPTSGYRGTDTFQYKFSDNRTNPTSVPQSSVFPCTSNTATVTITIRCAPDAVDDLVTKDPLSLTPITIDVLANDSPYRSGVNDAFCVGRTFGPDPIDLIPSGSGQGCDGPLYGTVTEFTDTDGIRKFRYTQTVALLPDAGDQFTYKLVNSNGCCDYACVRVKPNTCVERNRRQCGSLLVYPELDTTQGVVTLLTLTYACCDYPATNTLVEFRYINKTTCGHTDQTVTLTPCDTLTLLANAPGTGPTNVQGYVYAYAKNTTITANNPGGTPIVFNRLIGQELIMNGIQALNYSMNAVSFRGFGAHGGPDTDGLPNDDDGDGIRDLNGRDDPLPEYDEAPDKILIPRFLGQDQPTRQGGYYDSQLILIGLSGGQQFTTTVTISGFNNNANDNLAQNDDDPNDPQNQANLPPFGSPFGNDVTFYCWTKLALRDAAPFTLDSFLQNNPSTPSDPDEIALSNGTTKESGWLYIDGKTATSGVETIHDPAIYAVLIEKFGTYTVADLPFERCSQRNGDLIPNNPLGDGPNPVNGDDQ